MFCGWVGAERVWRFRQVLSAGAAVALSALPVTADDGPVSVEVPVDPPPCAETADLDACLAAIRAANAPPAASASLGWLLAQAETCAAERDAAGCMAAYGFQCHRWLEPDTGRVGYGCNAPLGDGRLLFVQIVARDEAWRVDVTEAYSPYRPGDRTVE